MPHEASTQLQFDSYNACYEYYCSTVHVDGLLALCSFIKIVKRLLIECHKTTKAVLLRYKYTLNKLSNPYIMLS